VKVVELSIQVNILFPRLKKINKTEMKTVNTKNHFWKYVHCAVTNQTRDHTTRKIIQTTETIMRRSIRKFNIPPPGNPRAFELLKIVQIPYPRGKKAVQMPHLILIKYLSSKTNFIFNQTLYTLFREICRNGTFKRLLKTLFERVIH